SAPAFVLVPVPRSLISFDGTRVHWLEYGRGYPIVVSSPLGIPFPSWQPLLARMARSFQFLFVKRRGLWGADIPADLDRLDVDAHARDIAAIVDASAGISGHAAYGMLGFCSGVAPMVKALEHTQHWPEHMAVFNGRFVPGNHVGGRRLFAQVERNGALRDRVIEILARFGPPALRDDLKRELGRPGRLESHLRAVEMSRTYEFEAMIPAVVPATFFYAEHDYEEIRSSTLAYVARLGRPPSSVIEIARAEHFFLLDQADRAADLVVSALGARRAA
ncbi:MAG TPA: hypothetical protein VFT22_03940, partial [Kofleriaceae bacterium]|nr:hypothetical protein [Kofleriaceae bacterium]